MNSVNQIMRQVGVITMTLMLLPQSGFGQNEVQKTTIDQADQVCDVHGIAQSACYICDTTKREKGRLWCKEHDRYEDRCFICHPDIKDPDRDWCEQHFLYEDECVFCRPSSKESSDVSDDNRDPKRMWCAEHDIYEDECVLCHPELKESEGDKRDPKRLWCKEHSVYEDECVICHPEIEGSSGTSKPSALFCVEHDVAEQECGICHPELVAHLNPGSGLKIRFASDKATDKAAVKTAVAEVGAISGGIEVFAEIMFNQNKFAHVALPVDGIIRSVDVDLGRQVKAGDVLATVTSVEISKAIGDYMRAIAQDKLREQTVERERTLRQEQITSERELQEAIAAHEAADAEVHQTQQYLTTFGLSPSQIARLGKENPGTAALEVRAPFDGEVVARTAVPGALVETGIPLFKIADRSTMWAMLNVPAIDIDHVKVGQQVEITLDAAPDQTLVGILTWVSAEVDERTRMAKARAEIPNPGNRLRSGTFARGRIITKSADAAVIIPQSSLQQVDDRPLAFVKIEEDLYEARSVTLGARQGDRHEVLAGLSAGETIVVENSFVMKSQLLLSRLGAGCVDD